MTPFIFQVKHFVYKKKKSTEAFKARNTDHWNFLGWDAVPGLLRHPGQHLKGQDKWREETACPCAAVNPQWEPHLQLRAAIGPCSVAAARVGGEGLGQGCDSAIRESSPLYYLTPIFFQGLGKTRENTCCLPDSLLSVSTLTCHCPA